MDLASEYRRQFGWRSWARAFEALPPVSDRLVLDLGCGVGDLAAELVARGARVIGIDLNEELLGAARARKLPRAEFRTGDLREPPALGLAVDGVWCSFAAAYFPDLPAALALWSKELRPGGWIALTEIDDLFGHEPLGARTKACFEAYARDALAAGRYDFHMGRKLCDHLRRSGFELTQVLELPDREFSFDGPGSAEVLDAWRLRLERMRLLRDFCGASFEKVRQDFLHCLTRDDHRSVASVTCCVAIR